ncbi:vanadium-dependent haloperoxidase [Spirosoma sp. 209]|uniref:vanadium-dependent haloperoxidase n=1 Tax=Spirosoma sp. 209 TaxID=1955701 RepID=UPI00098D61EF|nr:vanadium-dependent haloperoxidase [Spirosoma sp. 209]
MPPPGQNRLISIAILSLLVLLQSCRKQPDDVVAPNGKPTNLYSADVATKWASLQLKLTKTTAGFTPPVASRALGYAGLTMYESVVPGITNRKSLVGQLQGLTALPLPEIGKTYNWALSANAAQAAILRSLYANTSAANKTTIDSLETALLTQFKDKDETINQRSVTFGTAIANAVFEYSKSDGGHEGYSRNFPTSYVVPTGAGMWQPTENGIKIPMQPYWGRNRTFVKANDELAVPKPLAYSTNTNSAFFKQYMDVYNKSKVLTQTEKEIAVWWADNPGETFTPPGHSYNIAQIVVTTAKANLAKAAETFARTGLAVSDAFILCWRCKFLYNNLRPYTYVRLAIDPAWVPFWPAPPFPGFPSGHATQSSSAATVLAAMYGEKFTFTDNSHVNRFKDAARNVEFKARTFTSFSASAKESADSRFYGNIHTAQDNETGLAEGKKIGANINALAWTK